MCAVGCAGLFWGAYVVTEGQSLQWSTVSMRCVCVGGGGGSCAMALFVLYECAKSVSLVGAARE